MLIRWLLLKQYQVQHQKRREAIDTLHLGEIAGTIAGDNTIFILVRSLEKKAETLVSRILEMIEG